MTNELFIIKDLLSRCAEIGALECLKNIEPQSDSLTQRSAYKKYGAAWVKSCLRKGLITKKRLGPAKNSPLYYSRSELTAVLNAQRAIKLGAFDTVKFPNFRINM